MERSKVDVFYELVAQENYTNATKMINDGFNINETKSIPFDYVNALILAIRNADVAAVKFILSFNPHIDVMRDLIFAFDQYNVPPNVENGKIIANLLFDACYKHNVADVERSWENIFDSGNNKIWSNPEIFMATIDVFTNRTNFDLLTAVRRVIHPFRIIRSDLAEALVNIGFFLPEEEENRLFRLTFLSFDFASYIILKHRVLTISSSIEGFLIKKNKEFFEESVQREKRVLSTQNEIDQIVARTKEYSDRLITANCIYFIPDINLYPPNKQEKVLAFINSRAYSKLSYLPNEIVFKIFSEL